MSPDNRPHLYFFSRRPRKKEEPVPPGGMIRETYPGTRCCKKDLFHLQQPGVDGNDDGADAHQGRPDGKGKTQKNPKYKQDNGIDGRV